MITHATDRNFATIAVPRLFYKADNKHMVAGHVRIFGDRPGKGLAIYHYNEQAPGWALHRRWDFKLFCVHHVEPGKKATDPAGWHITWAGIKLKREYNGISLRWFWADNFKTGKRRV